MNCYISLTQSLSSNYYAIDSGDEVGFSSVNSSFVVDLGWSDNLILSAVSP